MTAPTRPSLDTALRLFRERFFNRTDKVAILAPWRKPMPAEAGERLDALLATHVLGSGAPEAAISYTTRKGITATKGRFRVGSYCPGPDNLTRWLCLDLDGAGHAEALADPRATALAAMAAFTTADLPVYLEQSGGGKGWHLWCFFDPPIEGEKAQALGRALAPRDAPLTDGRFADPLAGRGIEVFPKQAKLRKKGFGNMVWLPWWCGAKDGGNLFYRVGEAGDLEAFVPEELKAARVEDVDRVLAAVPSPAPAPTPTRSPASGGPAVPGTDHDSAWPEWRKKALLVLDNADNKRVVDSSALASATTMWPTWTDRLLGHNKMFSVPNSVLWVFTGNNPRISRELARRCVSIRIDPRMDRPWLRKGFRHPDLLDWVLEHRGELIHAILVLVRNWLAKGRPPGDKRIGSFERWSDVVGGILAAAGIEGFLENLDALYATADAEGTMWRDFVAAWWESFKDRPVRVGELFHLCTTGELMAAVLGDKSERSQNTRLGNSLQNARDRVFGGFRIENAGRDSHSKGTQYRLTWFSEKEAPESAASELDRAEVGATPALSLLSDFGD